jgi:hypothetical protein
MGFLRSGQIHCPVVVIASTGDPLFPSDVVQRFYQQIKAPSKELLVFDLASHLIFNECLDTVLLRLVEALKQVQVAETREHDRVLHVQRNMKRVASPILKAVWLCTGAPPLSAAF